MTDTCPDCKRPKEPDLCEGIDDDGQCPYLTIANLHARIAELESAREAIIEREAAAEIDYQEAQVELLHIRELCASAGCIEPDADCSDATFCMVEELRQRGVCERNHV